MFHQSDNAKGKDRQKKGIIENLAASQSADEELKKELRELKDQLKYKIDKEFLKEFKGVLGELTDFRNGYPVMTKGQQHGASGYLITENVKYFENIYKASQVIIELLSTNNPEPEIIKNIETQALIIKENLKSAMKVAQEELRSQIPNKIILRAEQRKLQIEYIKAIQKIELFGLSAKYHISDSISYVNLVKINGNCSSWLTQKTYNAFMSLRHSIFFFMAEYGEVLGLERSSQDLLDKMEEIMKLPNPPKTVEQQLAQLANVAHVRFSELLNDLDIKMNLSDSFVRDYINLYNSFQEFNLSLKHNEVKNSIQKELEKEQTAIRKAVEEKHNSKKSETENVVSPKTLQAEVKIEDLKEQNGRLDAAIDRGYTLESPRNLSNVPPRHNVVQVKKDLPYDNESVYYQAPLEKENASFIEKQSSSKTKNKKYTPSLFHRMSNKSGKKQKKNPTAFIRLEQEDVIDTYYHKKK